MFARRSGNARLRARVAGGPCSLGGESGGPSPLAEKQGGLGER